MQNVLPFVRSPGATDVSARVGGTTVSREFPALCSGLLSVQQSRSRRVKPNFPQEVPNKGLTTPFSAPSWSSLASLIFKLAFHFHCRLGVASFLRPGLLELWDFLLSKRSWCYVKGLMTELCSGTGCPDGPRVPVHPSKASYRIAVHSHSLTNSLSHILPEPHGGARRRS